MDSQQKLICPSCQRYHQHFTMDKRSNISGLTNMSISKENLDKITMGKHDFIRDLQFLYYKLHEMKAFYSEQMNKTKGQQILVKRLRELAQIACELNHLMLNFKFLDHFLQANMIFHYWTILQNIELDGCHLVLSLNKNNNGKMGYLDLSAL